MALKKLLYYQCNYALSSFMDLLFTKQPVFRPGPIESISTGENKCDSKIGIFFTEG